MQQALCTDGYFLLTMLSATEILSLQMKDMIQVEKRNSQEALQNMSEEAMED